MTCPYHKEPEAINVISPDFSKDCAECRSRIEAEIKHAQAEKNFYEGSGCVLCTKLIEAETRQKYRIKKLLKKKWGIV
jgi:hypothetical protein